jgi:hypothetical protein
MVAPLMGQLKEVTDSEGNVYRVYVPQITYPVITLPEIQKMTIKEIQALSPEVCYATVQKFTIREMNIIEPIKLVYMVSKLSAQELRTISPEKLKVMITRPSQTELLMLKPETVAIVITQLQERDLDEVLKKIAPSGYWYKEQAVFYDAWKKKDVTVIAKLVKEARVEQPEFFTAWGNYQNFADINWDRKESGFTIRQVLVSSIDYNWKEKFKLNEKIILTIDFSLDSREVQALQEMIKLNKDKIVMVILPWASGTKGNNYDNKDISTYVEIGKWGDRLFYAVKEVAPEIPVYLTVCVTPTMDAWVQAFKAKYDGIHLWNITNTFKAPLKKVYNMLSEYNKNIVLSVFECSPDTYWIPFDEAKALTLNNYQRAKEAGFNGVILMSNVRD